MVDLAEIANGAKTFACTLYKNQPGALIPTPFSEALHLVWDNICDFPGGPGLPPPPSSDFQGGQCPGVMYAIRFRVRQVENYYGTIYTTEYENQVGGFYGINSVFVENRGGRVSLFANCDSYNSPTTGGGDIELYGQTANITLTILFINIIRPDGQPDNCGDPPKHFPPSPPPPPGGYDSSPITFTLNDTTNYNFTFNFTPPPPPPSPGLIDKLPPIIINFNKLDVNLKIPLTFNFDGAVNFGGGGGGGGNFNQDDRDTINNINNTSNNTNNTTNNTNNNVDNFYTDYKKDRDRDINKPPLPTDFDPPKSASPPGEHLEERLAYVDVHLTVIPASAKIQLGGSAPDVVYAGWFEFQREGKSFPRDYIHFENNCFVAPTGADGYAFTLYNGYQGNAIAVVFKE